MSTLKKFFDTFGYIVLRNIYDKDLLPELHQVYDEVVTSHFGKNIEDFLIDPQPIIGGVEQSQELLSFFQNGRILSVVDELVGDDAVFWGSDLSTFKSGSNFHRDALGNFKFLKIGIYLQDSTAADGGHFSCIPGSHLYGDTFSDMCSAGLIWPRGSGYREEAFIGDFDFNNPILKNTIPSVNVDLSAGDIIFFDQRLVHAVPASNRIRRMIAITFFEGEKSFNARKDVGGEFSGLTHNETLIALRLSSFLTESFLGRNPILNYSEKLNEFDIGKLQKYLVSHSGEEFNDIKNRVLNNSYETAYRFLTKSNYVA
jgi:ectoine hydroxylase-related dioxygenase (phytanoyl-CoA dioxygenase family)